MNTYQFFSPVRREYFSTLTIKDIPLFVLSFRDIRLMDLYTLQALGDMPDDTVQKFQRFFEVFFEAYDVRIFPVKTHWWQKILYFGVNELKGKRKERTLARYALHVKNHVEMTIAYWQNKNTPHIPPDAEPSFEPANYDNFAHYYQMCPLSMLENYTPEQIEYFARGIEFNSNILTEKPEKNAKFLEKSQDIQDPEVRKNIFQYL